MSDSHPTISVIMAVYNGEDYLDQAIKSVLEQSYRHFEFIIIEDASTDSSAKTIKQYADGDERIQIIQNDKNLGLAASLNKGMSIAKGDYIARMDADDVALPQRLQVQCDFLKNHKDYVLCGSNAIIIDAENNTIRETKLANSDEEIRAMCLFLNPFVHPSVMMRTAPLEKMVLRYDESFDTTQDWAFWVELMDCGKMFNIEKSLIEQRHHENSTSYQKRDRQIQNSVRIQKRYLEKKGAVEFWDEGLFLNLNKYFLNDRESMIKDGVNRPGISLSILALLKKLKSVNTPNETNFLGGLIIRRCLLIGLVPPIEKGWMTLLGQLILQYPLKFLVNAYRIIDEKFR